MSKNILKLATKLNDEGWTVEELELVVDAIKRYGAGTDRPQPALFYGRGSTQESNIVNFISWIDHYDKSGR